eukprot:Em0021g47a
MEPFQSSPGKRSIAGISRGPKRSVSAVTSINSDQEDVVLVPPMKGPSPRSSSGTIYNSLDGDDFERVECLAGNLNATTLALESCKKTVLSPYLVLLKTIGWRRFRAASYDLERPFYIQVLNAVYPVVFFIFLLGTGVTQKLTCFGRSEIRVSQEINIVECDDKVVTTTIVRDTLKLLAYLYGLYLFRFLEPEYLSTLMETVFLNYSTKHVKHSHSRLTATLRVILALGFGWIVFSFCVSVIRIYSLQLLQSNTTIKYLNPDHPLLPSPGNVVLYNGLRWSLVIMSLFGFVIFDLLYISVAINYTSQCQLIIFYIQSITDRVVTKAHTLQGAVKDIYHTSEFLHVLNRQVATIVTLCLFIFVRGLYAATASFVRSLRDDSVENSLTIAVAIFNVLQWLSITAAPVIQAARLTRACSGLRRLGLEIAARPYTYLDTPQEELDSFLLYTTSTNYSASLIGFPIYPKYILAAIFVFGVCIALANFPVHWL